MKKPYEIRYLPAAENDLEEIFAYISKDKPTAAKACLEKFDESVSNLGFQPELGSVPRDDRLRKIGYRILVVGKYLVFYVVKRNEVQIRRIIHGARRFEFLL